MKKMKILSIAAALTSMAIANPNPSKTPPIIKQKNILASNTEHSLGVTLARYSYIEFTKDIPDFMSLKGIVGGFDYNATLAFSKDFFFKGDFRFAGGGLSYTSNGSGDHKGSPTYYIDMRALFGKDFIFTNQALSPFIGLGYRFLHNDGHNMTTTTGHTGYLRTNKLFYIPVGLTHRFAINGSSKIQTTVEYDQMVYGNQYSDIEGGINAKQDKGFGLRFSTQYQQKKWSIGPYLTYWNIEDSDIGKEGYEPKNTTTEIGLKVSFNF